MKVSHENSDNRDFPQLEEAVEKQKKGQILFNLNFFFLPQIFFHIRTCFCLSDAAQRTTYLLPGASLRSPIPAPDYVRVFPRAQRENW